MKYLGFVPVGNKVSAKQILGGGHSTCEGPPLRKPRVFGHYLAHNHGQGNSQQRSGRGPSLCKGWSVWE